MLDQLNQSVRQFRVMAQELFHKLETLSVDLQKDIFESVESWKRQFYQNQFEPNHILNPVDNEKLYL